MPPTLHRAVQRSCSAERCGVPTTPHTHTHHGHTSSQAHLRASLTRTRACTAGMPRLGAPAPVVAHTTPSAWAGCGHCDSVCHTPRCHGCAHRSDTSSGAMRCGGGPQLPAAVHVHGGWGSPTSLAATRWYNAPTTMPYYRVAVGRTPTSVTTQCQPGAGKTPARPLGETEFPLKPTRTRCDATNTTRHTTGTAAGVHVEVRGWEMIKGAGLACPFRCNAGSTAHRG